MWSAPRIYSVLRPQICLSRNLTRYDLIKTDLSFVTQKSPNWKMLALQPSIFQGHWSDGWHHFKVERFGPLRHAPSTRAIRQCGSTSDRHRLYSQGTKDSKHADRLRIIKIFNKEIIKTCSTNHVMICPNHCICDLQNSCKMEGMKQGWPLSGKKRPLI